MSKKIKSTYDKFVGSLTPQEKKEFEDGYRELLVSEMLIAIMRQDAISVRRLAEASGISPLIQPARGARGVNKLLIAVFL
jgi:hypothetical protein